MRLAFFSPCFSTRQYGGVQLTARLALEGLQRGTDEVRFLCYGPDCEPGSDCQRSKCEGSAPICSRSKAGAAFAALKNRTWPDRLLFWHADLLKLLPFVGARGRRKLLFLHGFECWRKVDGTLGGGLAAVDLFLSNSDFTWRKFIDANPQWAQAPHRIVPLGVGVPATTIQQPADVPVGLMIGRMSKGEGYKGHEEVIRAWGRVTRSVPGAQLWIAGGGDAADSLQSLAAASEASRVIRFLGVVTDADKDRLLQVSRCLLLPSRGEGFGLVYLEAMRFGRPCLASIHDAGREVVAPPDAGLAADPGDEIGLADAIARLLTAGAEWERWSANARNRYETAFTSAHFQRRLHDAVTEQAARTEEAA